MSFRRVTTQLLCGLAGGSAVLVAISETKGYLDKAPAGGTSSLWTAALGALQAAQPAAQNHTGTSGSSAAQNHTGTSGSSAAQNHTSGTSWSSAAQNHPGTSWSSAAQNHTGTPWSSAAQNHTGTYWSSAAQNHTGTSGSSAAQNHTGTPWSSAAQNHTGTSSGNGWDTNWDKRDPLAVLNGRRKRKEKESTDEELNSELEKIKPKATRHIFLIRHSQYNLNGAVDKERILTPLGREQAELTGQRLADLGLKYDVMVHSTMTRATETANIISKYLPDVETASSDLLREGAPIEPVPVISRKPESVYHEDGARIEAAFRRYIHRADVDQKEDSHEIIVCHANVIRYFVCRALQFPPEGWLRLCLNNGSITWVTIRPSGRVGLRMMGDSGFMPPDKLTRT